MGRGQGRGAFACAPDGEDFDDLLAEAAAIAGADELARFVDRLSGPVRRRLFDAFAWQAHGGQVPPAGEWRTWLVLAGRGFGKTRAGAEWVWACVRASAAPLRIALVGGSAEEAAKVMVEGPAGLLAAARTGEAPCWIPSRALLSFPGGSQAFVYSAEAPEALRGPEHHLAWCDEFAKWRRADAAWDNLQMGLRLGARPRCAVTTTPRPVAALRRVLALSGTTVTRGRTADNAHLSQDFTRDMAEVYGGTRLGRQELDGELLDDVAGALWPRDVIEGCRVDRRHPNPSPEGEGLWRRVVVGVDPPASAGGDACGIVVCGEDADRRLYVLADCSMAGLRPEGWARAVVAAAAHWEADRVVAEKNNGGDMVESVLRSVDAHLPVKLVSASAGKATRAAPVAARFEAGKAFLAGRFPALEDELAGLSWSGEYEGPGRSPRPPGRDGVGDDGLDGAAARAADHVPLELEGQNGGRDGEEEGEDLEEVPGRVAGLVEVGAAGAAALGPGGAKGEGEERGAQAPEEGGGSGVHGSFVLGCGAGAPRLGLPRPFPLAGGA